MTNQIQVIDTLKQLANSDSVANAVFHMWALRERARHEVTVDGLHARMKKEGFTHAKQQYAPLLELMARLGFGKLYRDGKGNIVALREVRMTLQSIGRAVCGRELKPQLRPFKKKNIFQTMSLNRELMVEPTPPKPIVPPKAPIALAEKGEITVSFDSKSLTFPINGDLSDEEIAFLINKFRKFSATI